MKPKLKVGETIWDMANRCWGTINDVKWFSDVQRWEYSHTGLFRGEVLGWIGDEELISIGGAFVVKAEREE